MNGILFFPSAVCPLKHPRSLPRSLAADPPSHDTRGPPCSLLQKVAGLLPFLPYPVLPLPPLLPLVFCLPSSSSSLRTDTWQGALDAARRPVPLCRRWQRAAVVQSIICLVYRTLLVPELYRVNGWRVTCESQRRIWQFLTCVPVRSLSRFVMSAENCCSLFYVEMNFFYYWKVM